MTLLIIYLLIAVIISFFCSISEAVILSARPSYVLEMKEKKIRGARIAQKLYDNLDRPLSAILTANTIAHTVGAAGVGAQANIVFGNQYIGLTSAILTLLILVFSEIIPKTLGATYWKQLLPSFAILIETLTRILFPFVWLSEKITRIFLRAEQFNYTFSRNEIEAMAKIGRQEGIIEEKELKILSNLMRLNKLSVRDIMTPRPVVFSVADNIDVKTFFKKYAHTQFSRIPIYSENPNDINGYVLKVDLLTAQAKDQFDDLISNFQRPFKTISNTINVSKAFDILVQQKSHIALVVNEYGVMQGIVTLEDIVETLIGLEITDELDNIKDMRKYAKKRWQNRIKAMGIKLE
ncbi:hemolysin family protein [Rickettsiales bacterium]|nr:hemolysin family protein [Rickettsiales bacterium]